MAHRDTVLFPRVSPLLKQAPGWEAGVDSLPPGSQPRAWAPANGLVKQVKALPGPGHRGTHRDLRIAFGLLNRAGHRVPTEPHRVTFLSFSFLLKNRSRKYTHFNPPTRADFVAATVPWGVGRGVGRARPVLIKVLAMSLSREMAGRDGR